MEGKIVVDKKEIDRLIRMGKYEEAYNHINKVREVIELVILNRIDTLLKNNIILDKEKNTFYKIIKNNIFTKLLEDDDYILIDETYVDKKKENLSFLKGKRRLKV